MDVFGIAVLISIFFCCLNSIVGLNPVWIIVIEIVLVAAIAINHIEAVICTELRKQRNQKQENYEDADEQ